MTFKIEEFVLCHNSIPVKFLKKFVTETFRVLYAKNNGDAKMVVNSILGSFGTKYHKNENSFLSNDFNAQCYAISKGYTLEEFDYTEDGIVKKMVLCSDRVESRLESDYLPMYINTIERGYVQLFKVLDALPSDAVEKTQPTAEFYE